MLHMQTTAIVWSLKRLVEGFNVPMKMATTVKSRYTHLSLHGIWTHHSAVGVQCTATALSLHTASSGAKAVALIAPLFVAHTYSRDCPRITSFAHSTKLRNGNIKVLE